MTFLNIEELNLPKDVIENSGIAVELIGEITGDENEIIVITQLGRTVGIAYVCHLSNGYTTRNGNIPCKIICDLPSFPKIIIDNNKYNLFVKQINGIKYTMACIAFKDYNSMILNWLY